MAKFPIYNPAVEEALSAPIASMSNAISLISDALVLGSTEVSDEVMSELFIDDDDRYRIYVVDLNKRGWLETPAPVIKMNGTVITPTTNGFEINYLGGCIVFFSENLRPTSSDIITASFTYVNGTSSTISGINTSISTLNEKTANYRGSFDSLTALESGVTNPLQYDYAYVFGTVSDIYFYDSTNSAWVSVTENDVADLEAQITALQNGKENSIGTKNTAFNKNFGTGNEEVMRGDYAYSKSATDTAIATKEPIISDKGTAFNKDFGTVTGTVAQGNYVAPSFTATTDFEDVLSGETTITLFGKIKRWFTEIGNKFDKENILSYDELSAVTEEGKYVPDAVAFNTLNENLDGKRTVLFEGAQLANTRFLASPTLDLTYYDVLEIHFYIQAIRAIALVSIDTDYGENASYSHYSVSFSYIPEDGTYRRIIFMFNTSGRYIVSPKVYFAYASNDYALNTEVDLTISKIIGIKN